MQLQIDLSKKQKQALDMILDWYKSDEQCFTLAGYAGSGKSTLARELQNILPFATFCAYTGKAAHVLRTKGMHGACTIHSLLYHYKGRDESGNLVFGLRNEENKLVVIDEYSMVDSALIADIKSKCARVLFIGDPAQLPPIKDGKQTLKPDFFLDEIHRQALDNPIVKYAHKLRNGEALTRVFEDGCFSVKRQSDLQDSDLLKADQIIVGKNKTKNDINLYMRDLLAFSDVSNIPVKGEKLICLQNNHADGLYNGMIFNAERGATQWDAKKSKFSLLVEGKEYAVWDGDVLGKDAKQYSYYSKQERFDYAYAITCHKAQGSEFDDIVVFDEAWGETRFNWLYTAVTRAKNKCTLVIR